MRTQTEYNKIVNYNEETKEITVLDYIFKNDSFKGATGTRFEIISKDYFDKTIKPYLDEPLELLKYYVEQGFDINTRMIDNIEEASGEERLRELFFDLSYSELWDYMREELNLSKDEAYIFSCSGGGRCFDKDYQGNYNEDLSQLIREIEA